MNILLGTARIACAGLMIYFWLSAFVFYGDTGGILDLIRVHEEKVFYSLLLFTFGMFLFSDIAALSEEDKPKRLVVPAALLIVLFAGNEFLH